MNCDVNIYLLALALKGVEYEYKAIHLVKDGGEQVCNNTTHAY